VLGEGLPNSPVTSVAYQSSLGRIRVGTYGRGVWDFAWPLPDISLKTVSTGPTETIIDVSNRGTAPAEGVRVVFDLHGSWPGLNVSMGGPCPSINSLGIWYAKCELGTLLPGASMKVTLSTSAPASGTRSGTGHLGSVTSEANVANNRWSYL
jgi:hypothetical protein